MARLASVEWRTPPPTSVDEVLVLYDDGKAVLVVRRPRQAAATVGSYVAHPDPDDLAVLAAAGKVPVTFDLLAPATAAVTPLMAAADRVAADSLATPRAVVTFHVHAAAPVTGGTLGVTLLAIAAGTDPVEFELDPQGSSVHFEGPDGQPLSWHDLPTLPTGFVTPDAEGLGGVVRAAHIEPGVYGAIAFDTQAPSGASSVSILVAGWLRNALPDDESPARFEVRTALVPIPG